jgi:hypothetical protein
MAWFYASFLVVFVVFEFALFIIDRRSGRYRFLDNCRVVVDLVRDICARRDGDRH